MKECRIQRKRHCCLSNPWILYVRQFLFKTAALWWKFQYVNWKCQCWPNSSGYSTRLLVQIISWEMNEVARKSFRNQIMRSIEWNRKRDVHNVCGNDCIQWMEFLIHYWREENVQTILNALRWIQNEESNWTKRYKWIALQILHFFVKVNASNSSTYFPIFRQIFTTHWKSNFFISVTFLVFVVRHRISNWIWIGTS